MASSAGTVPVNPSQVPNPTWGSFARWGAGFGIYAFIMVGAADGRYAEPVNALAWLIAIGAYAYWYKSIDATVAQYISGKTTGFTKVQPTQTEPQVTK